MSSEGECVFPKSKYLEISDHSTSNLISVILWLQVLLVLHCTHIYHWLNTHPSQYVPSRRAPWAAPDLPPPPTFGLKTLGYFSLLRMFLSLLLIKDEYKLSWHHANLDLVFYLLLLFAILNLNLSLSWF